MSNTLYETDFFGWTAEQAALLPPGKLSALDVGNIAEEIDSMGRSERHELTTRLAVLCTHFLKRDFQSHRRGRSWCIEYYGLFGKGMRVPIRGQSATTRP